MNYVKLFDIKILILKNISHVLYIYSNIAINVCNRNKHFITYKRWHEKLTEKKEAKIDFLMSFKSESPDVDSI